MGNCPQSLAVARKLLGDSPRIDWIQERAEDIANEKYEKEFYDLDEEKQMEVYTKAERDYCDALANQVDALYEIEREKGLRV